MGISLRKAVLLSALAAILLPSSASAWQYIATSGQPGAVSMPSVYPFEDGRYTTYGPYLMFTTFDRPYIYRSPATSGEQAVMGIYLVERWNGSQWYVASRQNTGAYTIGAGQRGVYLPRLWRSPGGNQLFNRGYFKVQLVLAWAANGSGVGGTTLNPNRVGDLRCQNMVRPCSASAQWVRLGRTYATGGGW